MAGAYGLTTVASTRLVDSQDRVITNATAYFQPCSTNGTPISFSNAGGTSVGAGQVVATVQSCAVVNGAFSINLCDGLVTSPANICYAVTIIDNTSGLDMLGPGYLIQPQGATFNFDEYVPNIPALALQVPGIQGPQGEVGATGPTGAAALMQIGSVTTVAPGGTATATVGGSAPNFTLSLGIPTGATGATGPAGPTTLAVFANTAAGLAGVSANGYFFIPSASPTDFLYDLYQSVSGAAQFKGRLPLQNVTSSTDGLAIVDPAGFKLVIVDLTSGTPVIPIIESRLEADESTIAAHTSEIAALTAYVEPANMALLFQPITPSSSAVPLAVLGADGFVATVLDTHGNMPIVESRIEALEATAAVVTPVALAIAQLNTTCLAFSRALAGQYNAEMGSMEFFYNLMVQYGQSLGAGYQTLDAFSLTSKYGNLAIGTQARLQNSTGGAQPFGDTGLHPLVEAEQSSGPAGETHTSGLCNFAKTLVNRLERSINNANKLFVGTNLNCPGESIAQLLPGAAADSSGFPSWQRVPNACGWAAADAAAANQSIGVAGTFWIQGEADLTTLPATYMANMLTLRAAFDAQYQTSFPSMVRQAGFYTYQTGGGFANDVNNMGLQMSQITQAISQPNWFCWGPHYAYPDLGGHLTANSYRWMGAMAAKVWFRTAVLRQGWQPLRPHKTAIVGNILLVGFHVPVPPLTIATAYNIFTPVNFPDLGFSLFDAVGYIPCTVSIVAETVVQLVPSRTVDWTTAYLRYADAGNTAGGPGGFSPTHGGRGNLCDSDSMVTEDVYAPSTSSGDGTAYNIAGLVGNPYLLNNWCVAFHIAVLNYLA